MYDTREYSVVQRTREARTFGDDRHLAHIVGAALNFFHPKYDFKPKLEHGEWCLLIYRDQAFLGYVAYPHVQEGDEDYEGCGV